jgi:chromosome segregation ATPase
MNLTMLGLRKTPTPDPAATPAEVLAAAETRRNALHDRLELARTHLTSLGASIGKARDVYLDELARAELAGGAAPSRSALSDLQAQLPAAEERVAALERDLPGVEREWRLAQADVLAEQTDTLVRESRRCETEVQELREQIATLQGQINERLDVIRNIGVRPMQLQAEAHRLRTAP